MKLQRLDEYFTMAVAVVIGVVLAYWFGLLAGAGETGVLMAVFGSMVFAALLLSMREHVWMLIPAGWVLTGKLPRIQMQPTLSEVLVAGVTVATFMLIAFKVIRRKPVFRGLDFWVWCMGLYIVTVFLRNPVGTLFMNSDRIGGRPYFAVAVSLAAYWVLSRSAIPNGAMGRGFLVSIMGARIANALLNAFVYWVPSSAYAIGSIYGVALPEDDQSGDVSTGYETQERLGFLEGIGNPLLLWRVARDEPFSLLNPLLALVHPHHLLRLLIFGGGIALCLVTGFRSIVLTVAGFLAITSWLHYGFRAVLKLALYAALSVVALVVIQTFIHPLPLSAQRTLSFLPGDWDPVTKADAAHSSEWRFEMWKLMLTTDKYIHNFWLGDGFGFSMQNFQLMQTARARGGDIGIQESFMIVGQVHSGPVSAIRFVGYVGLGLYLVLLIVIARGGWKLCKQTMGTEFQTITWYLCIPLIWEPMNFVFVFGSLDYSLPMSLYGAGLIKMLRNTVDLNLGPEVAEKKDESASESLKPQRRYGERLRPRPVRPRYPRPAGAGDQLPG